MVPLADEGSQLTRLEAWVIALQSHAQWCTDCCQMIKCLAQALRTSAMLHWQQFVPVPHLHNGVVRFQVHDPNGVGNLRPAVHRVSHSSAAAHACQPVCACTSSSLRVPLTSSSSPSSLPSSSCKAHGTGSVVLEQLGTHSALRHEGNEPQAAQ